MKHYWLLWIFLFAWQLLISCGNDSEIALDKSNPLTYAELITKGESCYLNGDFQGANKFFSMASRKHPDSATAHAWYALSLGRIASLADQHNRANTGARSYSEMSKAIELNSQNTIARMARGQNLLYAPDPYNDYPIAIKDFHFILEREPRNVEALYHLAMAYYRNRDQLNSKRFYDTIQVHFPGHRYLNVLDSIYKN
ncbi:MAG: tetratricopeptide repeat protein [Ferruginibacter sp.]